MKNKILSLASMLVLILGYSFSNPQTVASQPDTPYTTYLPLAQEGSSYDEWIGPYGGKIVSLAISRSNPQVLYAGTWGSGVFTTTDGGDNWISASEGLGTLYIQSVAVDPTDPQIVYAGGYKDEIYKSTDGGVTWVSSNTGIQAEPVTYSIAVDFQNPDVVFATTRGVSNNGDAPWNGLIYKSTDQGGTWTAVLTDIGGYTFEDWAYSIAIDPNNSNNVVAASHQNGPYISSDGGVNWVKRKNGASTLGRVISLVEGTSPLTLYYGSWTTNLIDTNGGVYKTVDGGEKWLEKYSGGIAGYDVYSISIDPFNSNNIYIGTFTNGMMNTTNGGDTWTAVHTGFEQDEDIYSVVTDPDTAGTYFAGTASDGIYRTVDGGANWSRSDQGLTGSPITSNVSRLDDPNVILASFFDGGVFLSNDHGETWENITGALAGMSIHSLATLPSNTNWIYALTDSSGLYYYDLSGATTDWIALNNGTPKLSITFEAAFDASHPLANQSISEDTLLQLQENEDQFTTLASTSYKPLITMVTDPSDADIAYLGTSSGVYRSQNGGVSWVEMGLSGYKIYSIVVDPLDSNRIYVTTNSIPSIKTSEDGGYTWKGMSLPGDYYAYSLSASPVDKTSIFAATDHGVYSLNSSHKWVATGLSSSTNVVLAHPFTQNVVYAGTSEGVYLSYDNGSTWQVGNSSTKDLFIQSLLVTDNLSSTMNSIFIGTDGHGILKSAVQ